MPINVTVCKNSQVLTKEKMFMTWMHTRKQNHTRIYTKIVNSAYLWAVELEMFIFCL